MNQDPSAGWDRHVDTYARLFAPLTGYIAQSMFRMVETRLPPGARLLDIACGTGALTLPALRHVLADRASSGARGLVVASDFSAGMLAFTRRAAEPLGPGEHLRCEVQNGESLTFADAEFDAAFSSFGIFLFGNRQAGWREAARVIRPGGVFATTVWRGPEHNPMLREQMSPMVAALPERLRQPPPKGSWLEIADPVALTEELRETDAFSDVEVSVFHASLALPDAHTAFAAMRDNPVMGGLLTQCSVDELAAIERSVVTSLGRLAGSPEKPFVLDSACHIVRARRNDRPVRA